MIRQGLQHAARTGAIGTNPAALVELPKIETDEEVEAMTPEEAAGFLKASEEEGPQVCYGRRRSWNCFLNFTTFGSTTIWQ